MFVLLRPDYLTHDGCFKLHSFTCKLHNCVFVNGRVIFPSVGVLHFHSPPVDGQLRCFRCLAIMNRAVMKAGEQVSP